jgi:uncharacterized protein (TIGR03435 family)
MPEGKTGRLPLQQHRTAITIRALAAGCIVLIAPAALAQAPATSTPAAKPLTFDVVTIKPHDPRGTTGWRLQPTPDGYSASNVSLLRLVGEAYGIYDAKLLTGGPSWIDTDKFDLEAKFDPADIPNAKDLSYTQRADMLRPVLADRFHLKVHLENKDFPVYDLVVAEGGPKLVETKPEDVGNAPWGTPTCLHRRTEPSNYIAVGCRPGDLDNLLRYQSGRTVIDKTGLTGRYDIKLSFTPENTPVDSPLAGHPTIFKALQEQLGLKLEPATAPLDILVIDSAEMPTPN